MDTWGHVHGERESEEQLIERESNEGRRRGVERERKKERRRGREEKAERAVDALSPSGRALAMCGYPSAETKRLLLGGGGEKEIISEEIESGECIFPPSFFQNQFFRKFRQKKNQMCRKLGK